MIATALLAYLVLTLSVGLAVLGAERLLSSLDAERTATHPRRLQKSFLSGAGVSGGFIAVLLCVIVAQGASIDTTGLQAIVLLIVCVTHIVHVASMLGRDLAEAIVNFLATNDNDM